MPDRTRPIESPFTRIEASSEGRAPARPATGVDPDKGRTDYRGSVLCRVRNAVVLTGGKDEVKTTPPRRNGEIPPGGRALTVFALMR